MPTFDEDDEIPAAAPATDAVPDWVNEGTEDDEDDIPGFNVAGAKPMEKRGQDDWIPPAVGVLFTIEKAVIESITPKGQDEWKVKKMNVWLKVTDGIVYKGDPKPKYKGKLFFHRFPVAVNREAEAAGIYNFSISAAGKPSVYYDMPSKHDKEAGKAWGDLNELLTALGLPTEPAPQNNKAFRDSLKGRQIVYDIVKTGKEGYDDKQRKYVKLKDEFQNELANAAPAKRQPTAASTATAAVAETPAWDDE